MLSQADFHRLKSIADGMFGKIMSVSFNGLLARLTCSPKQVVYGMAGQPLLSIL